jgi:ElaB/YqjD/DUF883 family membrane-anchored ribosome-binding protein
MTDAERYAVIQVFEERCKSIAQELKGINRRLDKINGSVAENTKRSIENEEKHVSVNTMSGLHTRLLIGLIIGLGSVAAGFITWYIQNMP